MIDPDSLRRFSMFRTVDSGALSALAGAMQRRSYPANAVLFRKGDPGGTMMLIMAGQVRIVLNDEQDHPITLRTLGAGQVVGEFSLLDHKSRTASASAVTALDVLVLQRADFIRILHERPLVGVELMRSLAERIRYATSYLERLYDATELLSRSEYDEAIREMALSSDEDEMRELITTFLKLVHRLRATDPSNRQK
ncbi:MAG: cyclic nucleotide-binding domain-containing protein [Anaerolineae bacterium]|nr:cyclic nucleotide-binding domain-containing protein [Anaerolineae bacterium]